MSAPWTARPYTGVGQKCLLTVDPGPISPEIRKGALVAHSSHCRTPARGFAGSLGRSFTRLTPPQRCHLGQLALFDCKKPSSNLIRAGGMAGRRPGTTRTGAAVSAKVYRPRQGRFGFGNETLHVSASGRISLMPPTVCPAVAESRAAGLVRRQYLAPQAIAVAGARPRARSTIVTSACCHPDHYRRLRRATVERRSPNIAAPQLGSGAMKRAMVPIEVRRHRSSSPAHTLAHYQVGPQVERVAHIKGGICRRPRFLKRERAIFHIGS
jgi:hypothetical protein